jgi:hypothetical protein
MNSLSSKQTGILVLAIVIISVLIFSNCKKRYTTCDCADLTYELYKSYDEIIFSEGNILNKWKRMRKAKKELKKDNRYQFCYDQGVRPFSIILYPRNKRIFESCESWQEMESEMDSLWGKIKAKFEEHQWKKDDDNEEVE